MAKYKGVDGGTISGEILCRSCRHETRIQGGAPSQLLVHCHFLEERIPFNVYECNNYNDKRLPSKNDLYDVAWILRTDDRKTKGQFGFVSPAERKREEKYTDPHWKDE